MQQLITRQLYYGTVHDGTVVAVYDIYGDWKVASLKDRDNFHFLIDMNGHVRHNGKLPPFTGFYFPNGYDLLLADLIQKNKEEDEKAIKRNTLLYRIKSWIKKHR